MRQPGYAPRGRPSTRKVVVVADDFTGAAESAAMFANSWIQTKVAGAANDVSGRNAAPIFLPASRGHPSRDVCVLDTESRNVSRMDALRRLESALVPWAMPGETSGRSHGRIWFKKIDSTLRGHVAAETFRMMEFLGLENAIIAPALPDEARTTKRGVQLVDGTPAASTHASRDAFAATDDDDLVRLFEGSKWSSPTLIAEDALDTDALEASALLESSLQEASICVIDASTNADLMRIAVAALRLQRKLLLVGSAGLARAVAQARAGSDASHPQPEASRAMAEPEQTPMAGVLVVRGSTHPNSIEQVHRLVESTGMERHTLEAHRHEELRTLASRLARAGLVLEAPLPDEEKVVDPDTADTVGEKLAYLVSRLMEETRIRGLAIAGGDSAYRILGRLGVVRLIACGEATRNLPMSRFRTRAGTKIVLVTKAGGFGTKDTMLRATRAVARATTGLEHLRRA